MRLLEARESFVKIESEKNIPLSSFVKVDCANKSYIAQVVKIQRVNNNFLVFAKLLYLYDGILSSYDASLPEHDAQVELFDFELWAKNNKIDNPVLAGKFIDKKENIFVDKTCFNKETIVSAETPEFVEVFVSNLKQELSKSSRTFVIDMQGIIPSQKFVAGKDFKLSLNTDSLAFMYEDCLNDTTSDSKSLIKEIFDDLSEYSRTVPFVPFGALKAIVDDMVDNSHIFKLLVLKNKLNKFDKMGYFATNQVEAECLTKILSQQSAYIDLSKLDAVFQNRYFEIIYNNLEEGTQVIVIASNSLSKKNLKTILTKQDIASVFVTHPRFKYINEIKSMFKNFVIEPSFVNNEVFKAYSTFLSVMNKNTYLLVGEASNYLPLISVLEKFPEYSAIEELANSEDVDLEVLAENIDETEEGVELKKQEVQEIEQELMFEKDEQTEAIEKKSNELAEKLSEDLENTPQNALSLFDEEQEEVTESYDNEDISVSDDLILEMESAEVDNKSDVSIEDDGAELSEVVEAEVDCADTIEGEAEEEIIEVAGEENTPPKFDYHTHVDDNQTIEVSEEIIEMTDEAEEGLLDDEEEIEPQEPVDLEKIEEISDNEIIEYSDDIQEDMVEDIEIDEPQALNGDSEIVELSEEEQVIVDEVISEDIDVLPIEKDVTEIEEVDEFEASESDEADIIVELDDVDEIETDEILEKEIMEDVDKVFTTIMEDSLSDNDLDLIDELNSEGSSEEFEELQELQETEVEELEFVDTLEEYNDNSDISDLDDSREILETKKSVTPSVPVYEAEIPAEDLVTSDPIEQGDTVIHAKYGTGVVEKMVKYGNKTLYSINFDNLGRRLLDPTLTEIEKG